MFRRLLVPGVLLLAALSAARAELEPIKPIDRLLPPKGIALQPAQEQNLRQQLQTLTQRTAKAQAKVAGSPWEKLLPDVQIFPKALELALEFGEFYSEKDPQQVPAVVKLAEDRITSLMQGQAPWKQQRGLLVRGYRSAIDSSVQPLGLHIPEGLDLSKPAPLYVFLHGRNEKGTDLHFILEHLSKPGPVAPPDAITLYPFGRQCIGYKSAAGADVLEAIDFVRSQYPVDADRIVLMGFSMGGGGTWRLGSHYADRFVAIAPGAGFAETARFNKLTPEQYPVWYERKLWALHDAPHYVGNLLNTPVIAYSGEIDKQKLAADIMTEEYRKQGKTLTHIVGPQTAHKYHPDSLKEILRQISEHVAKGRNTDPDHVTLQTPTLRFGRMHWLEALRLDEHWTDAAAQADREAGVLRITSSNIAALRVHSLPAGIGQVQINGQMLTRPAGAKAPVLLVRDGKGQWALEAESEHGTLGKSLRTGLQKSPGLQGPIDDAFVEPFLVVLPSGKSENPLVQRWVDFETKHFEQRWRALFRGQLRTKLDRDLTASDIEQYHLVLFGDTASNKVIARLSEQLPVKWTGQSLQLRGDAQSYDASTHLPVLIHPNPLMPNRYIVLNSGPTFREQHDRSNTLQNPKLGDWAVIDLRQAPDGLTPGRVAAAGLFDEHWQYKPAPVDAVAPDASNPHPQPR